jgi:hypothetical protein
MAAESARSIIKAIRLKTAKVRAPQAAKGLGRRR